MLARIPEPWKSFLTEIDDSIGEELRLECLGGFVVAMMYNSGRTTSDVDFIRCRPHDQNRRLAELAAEFSPLHSKYGLYLDFVTVVTLPDNYADRLTEMFPDQFANLRLFALGPYDLVLSKLERNLQHDREDMLFLVKNVPLDLQQLTEIYEREMKIYLEDNIRHRSTFAFWLELIEEMRTSQDIG